MESQEEESKSQADDRSPIQSQDAPMDVESKFRPSPNRSQHPKPQRRISPPRRYMHPLAEHL